MSKVQTRVVGCWSKKGGVGKTTSTINLAAAFAARGKTVAVWDLDPQGSVTKMAAIKGAKYPFDVLRDVDFNQVPDVDIVFIDYPPGMNGDEVTGRQHLLLVPFKPNALDLGAAFDGVKSLTAQDKFLPLLTMVDNRLPDHKTHVTHAEKLWGDIVQIPRRSIYERANNSSTTVFGMHEHNSKIYGVKEATAIFNDLADRVTTALYAKKVA